MSHVVSCRSPSRATILLYTINPCSLHVHEMDKDSKAKSPLGSSPESIPPAPVEIHIYDETLPSSGIVSPTKDAAFDITTQLESLTHDTGGSIGDAYDVCNEEQQNFDKSIDGEDEVAQDAGWHSDEFEYNTPVTTGSGAANDYWGDAPWTEGPWPPTGYTLVDTTEQLVPLLDTIEGLVDKVLWMDLEGNNLGRDGTLSVMQVFIDDAAQRRFSERAAALAKAVKDAEEKKAAEEAERLAKAEEDEKAKQAGTYEELKQSRWDKFPEYMLEVNKKIKQDKIANGININPPTEGHTWIVDVTVLKGRAFSTRSTSGHSTFKSLLEDPTIPKALWDCRQDSDALYWHYQIFLQGVLDVQLIDCYEHHYVQGYGVVVRARLLCCDWYDEREIAVKNKSYFDKDKDYSVFDVRPLSQALIDYCVGDVKYLPWIFNIRSHRLVVHRKWPDGSVPRRFENLTPSDYFAQAPGTAAWEIVRESENRVRESHVRVRDPESQTQAAKRLSPWGNRDAEEA